MVKQAGPRKAMPPTSNKGGALRGADRAAQAHMFGSRPAPAMPKGKAAMVAGRAAVAAKYPATKRSR